MSNIKTVLKSHSKNVSDFAVAFGIIAIILMFIIPLPTFLLDFLQSLNLSLSIIIILITLYTKSVLDFTIFPSVLLVTTIFSLALNVSSTKLILNLGTLFDGRIIKAFSSFVVGSQDAQGLIVGIIIYIILISVQFLVITKGSTRVSEVAARFTLDALPGKQMAIDQEYSSGLLTEDQVKEKKSNLQKEVDFYGAMDGASKFVSGNVVVGILITLVNIIGGIITGMLLRGESFYVSIATYTSLTVGDGLVSQLPSLLISTATGIIVTRSTSDNTFGYDIKNQFSKQSKIYWVLGTLLLLLSVLPGFPWYILVPMGLLVLLFAYTLSVKEINQEKENMDPQDVQNDEKPAEMSPVAPLDPISLEIGYALVPLVDKENGAELLDRITKIRKDIALELGLVIPRIRIIDNMVLEASGYAVKIRGTQVGEGVLRIGGFLCINPGGVDDSQLMGDRTVDPAFGLPAIWITEEERDLAEKIGLTVVDVPSVISTHLTEIVKRNASSLLGRKETKSIVDELQKEYSAIVDEILQVLSVSDIQKVLQGLLDEQISIRNIISILECISDFGKVTKDSRVLIEKSRQTLGRQICLQYADENNTLSVITLNPYLEEAFIDSKVETASGVISALDPQMQRSWINALVNTYQEVQNAGYYPILLCQEASRYVVKVSALRDIPDLVVLSVPEIVNEFKVNILKEIEIEMIGEQTSLSDADDDEF